MARSITDARQITLRQFLQQITNRSAYTGTADAKPANQIELDNLLAAIESELTPLLRLTASFPNDRIVSVGAGVITNSESGFARSIPHVGSLLPSFTSGTVTFPASSGGTITVSPGNNGTLTVSSGNYIKVLIYLDATGALNVLPGVENAVEASATVLKAPAKTLPIGYVTLQNVAGTIQNIAQTKIYQFGTGAGGGSSGTGSGVGSDLASLTFKAEINDEFDDIPSASTSAVDITAGKTDSTLYSAANAYYRLAYDASKTVTGTGTSMTLSGTPSFTVKNGDILRVGTEARRITNVASQTSYTIESAFTTNPSASAATVSQAVYSKDYNNIAIDGLAISTAFSTTINQVMVDYEDTEAADDIIFDANATPLIAFTASSDGTSYSNVSLRPTLLTDQQSVVNLPSSGTNMYVRFFSNKTSGSGFVNILKTHVYFHRDLSYLDGSLISQSYCMTDGSGTEINCLAPTVVSGKTRIQKTWTFPVGVNPGTTNGALKVYLNGQKIPRFVDSTLTPDASYREIDQKTIELDGDYSGFQYSVETMMDVAVVDVTDSNTTNISYLKDMNQSGFQPFVSQSAQMVATTSVGTPVAGTFYSTILNRAPMVDLSQDLRARMGVDRITTQQIYPIQTEMGPNGEMVWGLPNDFFGQVRFVGSGWTNNNNASGITIGSSTVNDYIEVTFYGTGLNLLSYYDSNNSDYRASVDGGAEGANFFPTGKSSVLANRNYSINAVTNAVNGLTLGVHTVKIRLNSINLSVCGFEILNEATTLKVTPGIGYSNGAKLVLSSLQSPAYNSTFESGTLGTRGGRVLVYQKSDGSIVKAVTPTNPSSALLAAADHTNEEVARSYSWREFGANRSDDFSSLAGSGTARTFTLEDGTTILSSSLANQFLSTNDYLNGLNSNGDFLMFTFVGTGLDIELADSANGGSDSYTYQIDGSTAVAWANSAGSTARRIQRVVSGLPYGTHTFRMNRVSAATWIPGFLRFIVYQPKKPTLPSGAVEIADYNIMANFVDLTGSTSSINTIATGVMRKGSTREFTYVQGTGGTQDWLQTTLIPSISSTGHVFSTDRSNAYVEYTFFGTGFQYRGNVVSAGTTLQVNLNGVAASTTNYPTLNSSVYGTGLSYNSGTGAVDFGDASTQRGAGFTVSNLPLARYTVRITNTTASSFMNIEALDIITPIHSHKSNIYHDVQNTLPIGNQGIADGRKLTPVKEALPVQKAWSQAVGVTSGPTTNSTSFVPMPDMSVTIKTLGGPLSIFYSLTASNSSVANVLTTVFVNGVQVTSVRETPSSSSGFNFILSDMVKIPIAAGVHKIDLYWAVAAGTATAKTVERVLLVQEN